MIATAAYEELRSSVLATPTSQTSRGGTLLVEEGMASWLSLQLSLVAFPPSTGPDPGTFPVTGGPLPGGVPPLTESREDLILALARMTAHQLMEGRP